MVAVSGNIVDKVVDGLTEFATAMNDRQSGEYGGLLYRRSAKAVDQLITETDVCKLAFPTMLIRPDLRVGCIVIILADRIVIGWKPGMFRKPQAQTIPFSSISSIRRQTGTGSLRGAQLLVIAGEPSATIALPVDKPDAAAALITAAIGRTADEG